MVATCDKCRAFATSELDCDDCSKVYRRCEEHGGLKGCRRSLYSHKALMGSQHRTYSKPTPREAGGVGT